MNAPKRHLILQGSVKGRCSSSTFDELAHPSRVACPKWLSKGKNVVGENKRDVVILLDSDHPFGPRLSNTVGTIVRLRF